jgi:Fe2+ or Zn2+ uptake regulation protein
MNQTASGMEKRRKILDIITQNSPASAYDVATEIIKNLPKRKKKSSVYKNVCYYIRRLQEENKIRLSKEVAGQGALKRKLYEVI